MHSFRFITLVLVLSIFSTILCQKVNSGKQHKPKPVNKTSNNEFKSLSLGDKFLIDWNLLRTNPKTMGILSRKSIMKVICRHYKKNSCLTISRHLKSYRKMPI